MFWRSGVDAPEATASPKGHQPAVASKDELTTFFVDVSE